MSEIVGIIDTLEKSIERLFLKIEGLEKTVSELKQQEATSSKKIAEQTTEIAAVNERYEILKMANGMLGSDDEKRETKLKINTLIREIDYCIAQLAD